MQRQRKERQSEWDQIQSRRKQLQAEAMGENSPGGRKITPGEKFEIDSLTSALRGLESKINELNGNIKAKELAAPVNRNAGARAPQT